MEDARGQIAGDARASVETANFFRFDWDLILGAAEGLILVLGNPPWVTNSAIGALGGANLPQKSNADGLRGIDALTGRANFDISEWMIRENVRWLRGRRGVVAVLCKTSVARKTLVHAWSAGYPIQYAAIHHIDAGRDFKVSVDACLLRVHIGPDGQARQCDIYETLASSRPSSCFGMVGDRLASDLRGFRDLKSLYAPDLSGWRSGVKHDCSRVFEFTARDGALVNGFGERVSVEPDVVFPLLKSSDLSNRRAPRKWVLIPQRRVNEPPERLRAAAPAAWRYLCSHEALIGKRASSIYANRRRFSIFGIGPYSFAPWKVATAGLCKNLEFVQVAPMDGRPCCWTTRAIFSHAIPRKNARFCTSW